MKTFLLALTLLIGATTFAVPAQGVTLMPSDQGALLSQDLQALALTTSFAGPNATFASSLSNKSNICLVNGGTTAIIGANTSSSCSVSTTANFVVPANGGTACIDRVKIKGTICLKYSTITYGVFGMPW